MFFGLSMKGHTMPKQRRQPDSELSKAALAYIEEKKLSNRNLLFNCRRFERLMGVLPVAAIQEPHFEEFRRIGERQQFTGESIRKTIISVKTVCTAVTGKSFIGEKRKQEALTEPQLVQMAERYVKEGFLGSRMIVSNCKRFCRQAGDIAPEEIKTTHLTAFRMQCMEDGLARYTIEKTITDVMTICRYVTGVLLYAGRRLKKNRPKPKPTPIEDIEKVFHLAAPWLRQWIVVVVWTGLRLCDSMRFLKALEASEIEIDTHFRYQAQKTGREHVFPVPDWFRPWLKPCHMPFGEVNGWSSRIIRGYLTAYCEQAGVQLIRPQRLRQRAVTLWMRANAAAGAVIHGKSLGVCDHYVDVEELLTSAAPAVKVPQCFQTEDMFGNATETNGDEAGLQLDVVHLFQQLTDDKKHLVRQTMLALLGKNA